VFIPDKKLFPFPDLFFSNKSGKLNIRQTLKRAHCSASHRAGYSTRCAERRPRQAVGQQSKK
jgi:hypothetical protein